MSGDQWCIHSGQYVNPELPASLPEATRHSQGGQIVPQIVEAEVFDPGTLFCLAQGWLRLLGQNFFQDKWICLSC